jgi:hypothetical protein
MEDDDDIIDNDASVTDEMSSSVSSENNASSSQDGYDTDIESGEFIFRFNKNEFVGFFLIEIIIQENHDITGKTQYRESCIQSKIIPCSYFMAHIQDKEMVLRYHQFNTDDIRAIAKILCVMNIFLL